MVPCKKTGNNFSREIDIQVMADHVMLLVKKNYWIDTLLIVSIIIIFGTYNL